MTDKNVRPMLPVIASFFIQKRERPANRRPFLFFASCGTKFHWHTSCSGRATLAPTPRIFKWTEHNRAPALRSSACDRDIIMLQGRVRQEKYACAALALPRDSLPTAPSCSFLCSCFFVEVRS